MAEEMKEPLWVLADISIKKCIDGFMVKGSQYGGEELRAFSTAEGLIEWLSRELGAGPIVWSLTLEVWGRMIEINPEDLIPVPDQSVDPMGYQSALQTNATIYLDRFVKRRLGKEQPKPPPKPKEKKAKKPKEEKGERPEGEG